VQVVRRPPWVEKSQVLCGKGEEFVHEVGCCEGFSEAESDAGGVVGFYTCAEVEYGAVVDGVDEEVNVGEVDGVVWACVVGIWAGMAGGRGVGCWCYGR